MPTITALLAILRKWLARLMTFRRPAPALAFRVRVDGRLCEAVPSHAIADRLFVTVQVDSSCKQFRLIGIDEAEDREAWLAAWKRLGGAAMGLCYEDGTPYTPGD